MYSLFPAVNPYVSFKDQNFKTSYHFQRKQYSINSFAKFTQSISIFLFFYSERENFASKSTSQSTKRKKYTTKSIKWRLISKWIKVANERGIDFEIDKSEFQTRKFHLKIDESEFETLRISLNFNNRISQSFRTRSKLINSKIDESRNSNFWPRIYDRWRTTNSLKMKQRTFYNVFENGPRVAGGKRRCDSCEFQGVQRFSNFFRGMPAPWPPYAKTERRENSLRVNCCRPTENLQILWTASGVAASTFILAERQRHVPDSPRTMLGGEWKRRMFSGFASKIPT